MRNGQSAARTNYAQAHHFNVQNNRLEAGARPATQSPITQMPSTYPIHGRVVFRQSINLATRESIEMTFLPFEG